MGQKATPGDYHCKYTWFYFYLLLGISAIVHLRHIQQNIHHRNCFFKRRKPHKNVIFMTYTCKSLSMYRLLIVGGNTRTFTYRQGAVRYGRHTVATHASKLHTSILTPGGHSAREKLHLNLKFTK